MTFASIEGNELAAILGTYTALFVACMSIVGKMVFDTRREAKETNRVVNNRPKDMPTLRALVETVAEDLATHRDDQSRRHIVNSARMSSMENKLDRLGDAVRSANGRLDHLEQTTEEIAP